jgi:putative transposase
MRASLAVNAITAAHRADLAAGNAIMHTDRGGQGGINWSSQHLD